MNAFKTAQRTPLASGLLVTLVLFAPLSGCLGGGGGDTVVIRQAGSSTVLPVAQVWAEEFGLQNRNVQVVVSGGGSGAGIQQFCRGEIDVADASRPMKAAEADDCKAAGITPVELQIAIDGLAVVVDKENSFVDFLTVEELNRMWTADPAKQANKWSDLRPQWPADEIELYGPGTDSGTFDYFVEAVVHPYDGTDTRGRADYVPSEDDNVLVQGVAGSPNGLGYFGLYYARANDDKVRIVPIDAGEGDGPVEPTNENVETGRYTPLSRPLYMYVDGVPAGELLEYFLFAYSVEGQDLVEEVGYIRLPATRLADMRAKLGVGA